MDVIELREYTTRIKELESAIYTQKRLMKEHEAFIKSKYPKKPQRPIETYIEKPRVPYIESDSGDGKIGCSAFLFILGGIGASLAFSNDESTLGFLCVLLAFVGVCVFVKVRKTKESDAEHMENYKKECVEYSILLSERDATLAEQNRIYDEELKAYNDKLTKVYTEYDSAMKKHKSVLLRLEMALNTLYDENVIYPKYRNLVAMAAISEYLLSGRCNELEGANGAYNLYEMELRQNIIIGQLSNIVSNLEQIRNNQYSLYEELSRSNMMVNDILYELKVLNRDTKLIAYFSGVTALAEVSPKYYHGVIM